MLKEGYQGRGDRDDLLGRDVDVIDLFVQYHHRVAEATSKNAFVDETAVIVEERVRLRDRVLVLLVCGHVNDLTSNAAIDNAPVGRLDESKVVDTRVGGKRGNETDVRAFRSFDGTDAPVVGAVHVADIESCPLTGKATRSKGRDPALVPELGQGVYLVLELAQLAAAEELAQSGHDWPVVDELLRSGGVGVAEQHALTDTTCHSAKANPNLIGNEFADRADAPVAEVVDVVFLVAVFASLEVDEVLDGRYEPVIDELAVLKAKQGVGRVFQS